MLVIGCSLTTVIEMAAKKGSAAWKREYRDVIVGWHRESGTIRKIYVQNDGTMSGDFNHYPAGRSAEHEAFVVYGLSKAQSFPLFLGAAIKAYEEKLRNDNGTPDVVGATD